MFFLWIGVMSFALPLVTPLDCFTCVSMRSMQDCVDFQKETRCLRETDQCRNMTVQVYVSMIRQNVTGYQRGCATHAQCLFKRCSGHFAEKYGEKSSTYNFCRMSCCQENLCPQINSTSSTDSNDPVMGARGNASRITHHGSVFAAAVLFLSAFSV